MKELKNIIMEIKELDNDKINTNLDETKFYESYKNNTLSEEAKEELTEEFWNERAEEIKQKAINFITRKYSEIDKNIKENNSAYSEYDYEIAYFKTFEQYFNIILNQEKTKEIDNYLKAKMDKFFNELQKLKED